MNGSPKILIIGANRRLVCSYFDNHGIDVRSIRYPGLISHKMVPGGDD